MTTVWSPWDLWEGQTDREVSGCLAGVGAVKKGAVKGRWLKIDQLKGMGSGTQSGTCARGIGTLYANCLKAISVQDSVQGAARFNSEKTGAQVESEVMKWLNGGV